MAKLFKWFFMLSKRLYKKPSFIALLLLIPICVATFSYVATEKSGFVHIVLAKSDPDDALASKVIEDLSNQDTLVNFIIASSEEEALDKVKNGNADEAWIFAPNTEATIKEFVSGDKNHAVTIYTKEQNVMVRLSREKLTGALYRYCAKAYYIEYIRSHFPELDTVTDEQLSAYYQNAEVDDSLFKYEKANGDSGTENKTNHLTLPIRGLLAFFAVLCGMAATLYYKQDEKGGTFSFIKANRRMFIAFGCVFTAVLHVMVVLLISLMASSLAVNILKEILLLLLYAVCCTSFCLLLGVIFTSVRTYSAIIPMLTVVCIGVCPIFFDFRRLFVLQMLLPPTYYVNAVYDSKYILFMLIYSVACLGLCFAIEYLKTHFRMWQGKRS